jgi:chromate reductase, NAD(P)H dehydrogenase (quinone)
MSQKKILALPGSLRSDSSSHIVLEIIKGMVPASVDYEIFDGIGDLPHFNDPQQTPESVINFKSKLKEADGVVICIPEYAFGVPGSFKNALDWTVGSGEFYNKPLAMITASSHGEKAHVALQNILTAISADVPKDRQLLIQFIRAKLENGKFKDAKDHESVNGLVQSLIQAM